VDPLAFSNSFAHGIIILDHRGCFGLGKNAIFKSLAPAGVTFTDAAKANTVVPTAAAVIVREMKFPRRNIIILPVLMILIRVLR
jgi:hypothetical protein